MEDRIDIDAWRADGERLWNDICDHGEVSVAWRNPWFRLLLIGGAILAVAVVSHLLVGRWYVSLPIAVYSLLFIYNGLKFLVLDRHIGGLHFFYTAECFGIGGATERIAIPFSAVVMPKVISPWTVNSNYIDLPVPPPSFEAISVRTPDGRRTTWDGRPFKQAIAQVRIADGKLIAKAYPNEFIVNLFSTLWPLLIYLDKRNLNKASDATSEAATGADSSSHQG